MSKKTTFVLAANIIGDATGGILVGEFNDWDESKGIELKKQKDGSFSAEVPLEAGQTYQYRYLLNDGRWVNDGNADSYAPVHALYIDNCVITVAAETDEEPAPVAETAPKAAPKKTAAPKKAAAKKAVPKVETPEAPAADDLTKIEGIGKKISELLVAENITTFKELAKTTPKKIKSILDAAGSAFQLHDPGTWPKQAKLAATAKWDELKTLQDELKGGK